MDHVSARAAILDGQLDNPAVQEHLTGCGACGGFVAALQIVDRLSPQIAEVPSSPADLAGRVLDRLLQPHRSIVMGWPTGGVSSVLRRHRVGVGLTQSELAERAGLSVEAISAIERGTRRRPRPHTLRALASALHLSESDRSRLLRLADEQPDDPTPPVGSRTITADHVKQALEVLHRPHELAQAPLGRLLDLGVDADGARLKIRLVDQIQHMADSLDARERVAGRLLVDYYVRKVGSHEVIAERLHLTRATFYRRLHLGLGLLGARLATPE